MQRRLAKVSTELAMTDTELLCERAHSQHLAQERQEVAERERSLSRQVDVAVMVIAALREQLNASENELERRERLGRDWVQFSLLFLIHSSRGIMGIIVGIICSNCFLVFQGGDNHPEVFGSSSSTGDKW